MPVDMVHPTVRLVLCLALPFLLLGCLSVETRIEMEDSRRGELTYIFTLSRELLEAQVFDRDAEVWPVPIARRDFELMDHALPEAELLEYSREDGEEESVVTAVYRFDSLEALARLLSTRDSLELPAGGVGLKLPLSPAEVSDLGEGELAFLESYFDRGTITYRIETPSPILESSLGEPSGRTLRLDYTFRELLDRSEPLELELVW